MSDLQHRTGNIWKDAEALVERVEESSRSNAKPRDFYDDLVSGVRLTARASTVSLSVSEGLHRLFLARSGIMLHHDLADAEEETDVGSEGCAFQTDPERLLRFAAQSRWSDAGSKARLIVSELIQANRSLQLELRFDAEVELALRQPLSELAEVILDLAAPVVMREELAALRSRVHSRADRDRVIRKLNEGVGLSDSFASIAAAVAPAAEVDRVSLLQCRGRRYRMIATSTQQKVERRARQVRLLERLVETSLRGENTYSFRVGTELECSSDLADALESYCHQSGSREIYIRSVQDEQGKAVAAYVLEQFHGSVDEEDRIDGKIATLQQPLEDAVRGAVRREDAGWGFLVSRISSVRNRKAVSWVIGAFTLITLAACFIPMELAIPIEGRLVASRQSRLFAPMNGIVSDIPVQNGQSVRKGQLLVLLRSPRLELERRTVEGTLATARTRLASLIAMRSRSSSASRADETVVVADEQVIRKEIDGLQAQLELLQQQQAELNVVSPLEGTVDRWDLQQSLQSRPVTHGQYLLDVLAEGQGWTVELEIPEDNVHYVLDQQRKDACVCKFRLRSDPTVTFEGTIEAVADVAHLDPTGQSMVRATLQMDSTEEDLRAGATVVARVQCGKYPLGFVGLRGLIEWYRSNRWF